jgi:geranylgeranyl diphosphate synthase, type I
MPHDYAPYFAAIESALQQLVSTSEEATTPLFDMMRYHMGWLDRHAQPEDPARSAQARGKRLRPLLCLLASEANGGAWRAALPAACAIELIHNFSLIHDDIEDNSETRRHRTTVWSLWGVPQGLNTGDAMWAVARLAVYGLRAQGHAAEVVLRVAQRLDETCLELCRGQYLDLHFEAVPVVAVAQYERMIAGKTAALIATTLAVGALLGGAAERVVQAYAAFGRELGLTFQITDDYLGVWGDPAATGKSAASDILSRKKALPALYALQWEREQGYTDLASAMAQPLREQEVPGVLALLERAGARAYVLRQAEVHQARTLAHLEETGMRGPAQEAIRELALAIVGRTT